MKNYYFNHNKWNVSILILVCFFLHSCEQEAIPPDLVGQWKTGKNMITVRTKNNTKRFEFTSDSANIILNLNSFNIADGSIGFADFKNAKIRKNSGNPDRTGVAYIVKCGQIGKIFENDPLDLKEVELWLGPVINGTIDGELRYTQGLAYFPMAGAIFTKVKD